jgi:hypothetical protein
MALREVLARFGFQVDSKALEKGQTAADGFATKLGNITKVLAAGALVQAGRQFVSDLVAQADQLKDTSNALGVNAQDLQRWQLAAKLSGAETADLAVGLKNVSKVANDSSGSAAIKSLGVDLKDANGNAKTATQLLGDVGLEIAKLPSATERTAKALEFFGKSGNKLLPMFADGEEGLQKMLDRLDELGGGLGDDALDVLTQAGDATDEFNVATDSLKSRLAVALFPALNKAIGGATKLVAWFTKASEGSNIFRAAIVVLGTAAAAQGLAMLAPWIPMLAILAGLILLVDDLITLFQGGDSAIGRFVDSLFGVGSSAKMVETVKAAWSSMMGELGKAQGIGAKLGAVFRALWPLAEEAFSQVGAKIVGAIVEWASSVAGPAKALGLQLLSALAEGLFGLPVTLSVQGAAGVQALIQAVIREALELTRKGQDLANGMVEGFVQGITGGVGKAVAAVSAWGDKIENTLRDKFGWNSPADLTFDLGYEGLTGGAVEGLKAGEPMLARQTDQSFGAAVPRGLGGGGGAAGRPSLSEQNTVHVTVQTSGQGPSGVREAARQGTLQGLTDARRALLASLEPVAPDLPVPVQ